LPAPAGRRVRDALDRFSVAAPYFAAMKPCLSKLPAGAAVPESGWWWRPSEEWARGARI
jgi:hypothetical protein